MPTSNAIVLLHFVTLCPPPSPGSSEPLSSRLPLISPPPPSPSQPSSSLTRSTRSRRNVLTPRLAPTEKSSESSSSFSIRWTASIRPSTSKLSWLLTEPILSTLHSSDPADLTGLLAAIYFFLIQSISLSINHYINQSIYQSINISINQYINISINQFINQSINQSIKLSMYEYINHIFPWSIDPIHHYTYQLINLWI